MDKFKQLGDLLTQAGKSHIPVSIFSAKIVSIEGESCTVEYGTINIDDVRLKATINGNQHKIIVTPTIGSYVLVGSLTGDLKDLCVLSIDEMEKIEYVQDETKITINSTTKKMQYEQSGLKITADGNDKKVSVLNDNESLFEVMNKLFNLLMNFKVLTASGPSSGLLATTMNELAQWKLAYNKILK